MAHLVRSPLSLGTWRRVPEEIQRIVLACLGTVPLEWVWLFKPGSEHAVRFDPPWNHDVLQLRIGQVMDSGYEPSAIRTAPGCTLVDEVLSQVMSVLTWLQTIDPNDPTQRDLIHERIRRVWCKRQRFCCGAWD